MGLKYRLLEILITVILTVSFVGFWKIFGFEISVLLGISLILRKHILDELARKYKN